MVVRLAWIDHAVASFAVVVVVKAFHLSFAIGTDFHEFVQDHKNNQGSERGVCNCHDHGKGLDPQLLESCPATACDRSSVRHPAI